MISKRQKFLIALSLVIAPAASFLLPDAKDIFIASIEFLAEVFLLFNLTLRIKKLFQSKSERGLKQAELLFGLGVFLAFVADCLYSMRILKITNDSIIYNNTVECLYGFFAILITAAVVRGISTFDHPLKKWGWIGLIVLIVHTILSIKFIEIPYYEMPFPLILKINSTIYAAATCILLSSIMPFAFRVIERNVYWFCQLLIFFIAADFAIRYQTSFVNVTTFSWAEFGWCTSFVGLSWLVYLSREKQLLISKHTIMAPFISIRSLFTLVVCGVNTLFLAGILLIRAYSLKDANDVSIVLFLLFIFWILANEFSLRLSNDLGKISPFMFKGTENMSEDGTVMFKLKEVQVTTSIFEISEILHSYNKLVGQANSMIGAIEKTNRDVTTAYVARQVSHDIRSPLSALDVIWQALAPFPKTNAF